MKHLSKIHFQDEYFIRKNSLQCNLFLQVAEKICRVLILDEDKNIRLLEEQELALFLNKDWSFINLKFAKVVIMTLPETFIFLPKEFENVNDKITMLAPFLDPNSRILNTEIKNTSINNYFTINESVFDFQSIFNESIVIPSSNILIQKTLSIAPENKEIIGINFYKKDFELVYIKNKQFIFYNRFPKENADDFNFYILSAFEQFNIQPARAQFYLSGNINESDENYERLAKYSSHIHFSRILDENRSSITLDNDSSNHFFLLSELSKCE